MGKLNTKEIVQELVGDCVGCCLEQGMEEVLFKLMGDPIGHARFFPQGLMDLNALRERLSPFSAMLSMAGLLMAHTDGLDNVVDNLCEHHKAYFDRGVASVENPVMKPPGEPEEKVH